MDENTQSGLDARAAKTLDGLNLTPRPKPAVQQEVSQDPFTDRALSRAQRRRARDAESPTRLTQYPAPWRPDAAVAGPDHTHAGGTAVDGEPGATAATGKLLTDRDIDRDR